MVVARHETHLIVGPWLLLPGSNGIAQPRKGVTVHAFEPDQLYSSIVLDSPNSGHISPRTRELMASGRLVYHPMAFDASTFPPQSVHRVDLHNVLNSLPEDLSKDGGLSKTWAHRGVPPLDRAGLLEAIKHVLHPKGRVFIAADLTPDAFPLPRVLALAKKAGFVAKVIAKTQFVRFAKPDGWSQTTERVTLSRAHERALRELIGRVKIPDQHGEPLVLLEDLRNHEKNFVVDSSYDNPRDPYAVVLTLPRKRSR